MIKAILCFSILYINQILTSIFLIITLLPLVYKKFFPLGSPPNTRGCPLCVLGNVANIYSVNTKN